MKLRRFALPVLLLLILICIPISVHAAESYPKLTITKLPNKLVYSVYDSLDKTGLVATLWDSASMGEDFGETELMVSYDFSSSGKKTVTVRLVKDGKTYSTSFEAYVLPYTRTLQPSSGYPQHTYYAYNLTKEKSIKTYTCPGASGLLLQFSGSTSTDCCDYIYLSDGKGQVFGPYEDNDLSGKKLWIEGNSFSIWIESDEDDCCNSKSYGYRFDAIWSVSASACTHLYGDETITAATCDQDGKIVKECVGCGNVSTTIVPKLSDDGKHRYDYEQYPMETFVSGYYSYYDLYYVCKTCGHKNVASGYPGSFGEGPDHGVCGQTVRWALMEDGTMVLFRSPNGMSYYTMYSVPEKASQAKMLYVQDQITTIYPEAFKDAYSLTSVRLPASLQTIGQSAFSGCTKLETINFPGSLTSIGKNAFRLCTSLASVDFGTCSPTIGEYAFTYCEQLKSVRFGTGAVTVGFAAFEECPSIAELDIPARVTLDRYAFHKCTGLTSATVRCKTIPDSAFESCWALSSVTLENTESIGEYSFGGTASLQNITFPATLKSIDRAFTGQAGYYPALRTATFLTKDIVFTEHPFPSVSTKQLTIRGSNCSTAAAFAKQYGYPFSATDNTSHAMQITPAVEPACQIEGFTRGEYCTACGYIAQKRTSLGFGDHQMGQWRYVDEKNHGRSCSTCETQTVTQPHERTCGYCAVCKDDAIDYDLRNGALTLFCKESDLNGVTVVCALYNQSNQMLLSKTMVWDEKPVCIFPTMEEEEAVTFKVFFLIDNCPQRPVLTERWQ